MVLNCWLTKIVTLYQVYSKSLRLGLASNHRDQKNGSFNERSAADQHERLMHYITKIISFLPSQSQTDHSHESHRHSALAFSLRDSNSKKYLHCPTRTCQCLKGKVATVMFTNK